LARNSLFNGFEMLRRSPFPLASEGNRGQALPLLSGGWGESSGGVVVERLGTQSLGIALIEDDGWVGVECSMVRVQVCHGFTFFRSKHVGIWKFYVFSNASSNLAH